MCLLRPQQDGMPPTSSSPASSAHTNRPPTATVVSSTSWWKNPNSASSPTSKPSSWPATSCGSTTAAARATAHNAPADRRVLWKPTIANRCREGGERSVLTGRSCPFAQLGAGLQGAKPEHKSARRWYLRTHKFADLTSYHQDALMPVLIARARNNQRRAVFSAAWANTHLPTGASATVASASRVVLPQ